MERLNRTVNVVCMLQTMAIDEMALSTDGFPPGPRHAITYNSVEDSVHGAVTRFGNSGRSSQPNAAQGSAPASGGGSSSGGVGSGGGGSGGIVHSSASLQLGSYPPALLSESPAHHQHRSCCASASLLGPGCCHAPVALCTQAPCLGWASMRWSGVGTSASGQRPSN